jgi:rod shape determining protein RodA
MLMLDRRLIKNFDMWLVIICLLLVCAGIACIYSTTHFLANSDIFLKQIMWLGIGLAAMLLTVTFNYRAVKRWAYVIYAVSLILLVAVIFIGKTVLGAQRWLMIGPFSFQPSEFAKLALFIALAKYLTPEKMSKKKFYPRDLLICLGLFIVPFIIILKEPDLGSALVLIPGFFAILYFAGAGTKYLLALVGMGAGLAPIAWFFLKDYQKTRLLVFLNPKMDPLGVGYHLTQSKITIGSGKLLGKGFLMGTQTQLRFLPKQHTDFIFSVIGEEFGLIGVSCILILYLLFIYRSMRATLTGDLFGRLLAVGIISGIVFQVFVNIGMSTGIMPVTGIPLPFLSYGGSSLVFTFIGIGLILNIRMRNFMF